MLESTAKLIHDRRKQLNLTIEQLAELAGVSVSLLSRIERADVENISVNKLDAIATALKMDVADFFIESKLSGIYTLELLKYLESLPDEKRESLAKHIMEIIRL